MDYFGDPFVDDVWGFPPPSFYPQPQIRHRQLQPHRPHRSPLSPPPPLPPVPTPLASQPSLLSEPPSRLHWSRVIPVSSGNDDVSTAEKFFEPKPGTSSGRRSHNQDRRPSTVAPLSAASAALRIQRVFRGFLVRRDVRRIHQAAAEVDELDKLIVSKIGEIRSDPMEWLRLNEMLMKLVLRLDSIHRGRDYRRKVVRRAIALQDFIDFLAEQTPAVVGEDSETAGGKVVTEEVPQENDFKEVTGKDKSDLDEVPVAEEAASLEEVPQEISSEAVLDVVPVVKKAVSLEEMTHGSNSVAVAEEKIGLDTVPVAKEAASLEEMTQENSSEAAAEEKSFLDKVPVAKEAVSLGEMPQRCNAEAVAEEKIGLDTVLVVKEAASLEENSSEAAAEEKAVLDEVLVAKEVVSLEEMPGGSHSEAVSEEKIGLDAVSVAKEAASPEEITQENNSKTILEEKADPNDLLVDKEAAASLEQMPQENNLKVITDDKADLDDLTVAKGAYVEEMPWKNNRNTEMKDLDDVVVGEKAMTYENNHVVKEARSQEVVSAVPFLVREALQVEDLERASTDASADGFEVLEFTKVEHEQDDGRLEDEDFVYLSDEDGLKSNPYPTVLKPDARSPEAAFCRPELDGDCVNKYQVENGLIKPLFDMPAGVQEKYLVIPFEEEVVRVAPTADEKVKAEPVPMKPISEAGNSIVGASDVQEVVEKLATENRRLQRLVGQLTDTFLEQTQLLIRLTERVEHLEQKMQSEKKKKRKHAFALAQPMM